MSAAELGPICGDDVGDRLGRRLRVAEQAEERDQRDQRREQRQQPVVGERRRPVGHVVLLELERGALERRPQAGARVGALGRVVGAAGLDVVADFASSPPRRGPRSMTWPPVAFALLSLIGSLPCPGFSSPGHEPVARANATRVPRLTNPRVRRKIAPSSTIATTSAGHEISPVFGLGRLLVGKPAPDELESLRGDQAREQAAADADRGEDDLTHGGLPAPADQRDEDDQPDAEPVAGIGFSRTPASARFAAWVAVSGAEPTACDAFSAAADAVSCAWPFTSLGLLLRLLLHVGLVGEGATVSPRSSRVSSISALISSGSRFFRPRRPAPGRAFGVAGGGRRRLGVFVSLRLFLVASSSSQPRRASLALAFAVSMSCLVLSIASSGTGGVPASTCFFPVGASAQRSTRRHSDDQGCEPAVHAGREQRGSARRERPEREQAEDAGGAERTGADPQPLAFLRDLGLCQLDLLACQGRVCSDSCFISSLIDASSAPGSAPAFEFEFRFRSGSIESPSVRSLRRPLHPVRVRPRPTCRGPCRTRARATPRGAPPSSRAGDPSGQTGQ